MYGLSQIRNKQIKVPHFNIFKIGTWVMMGIFASYLMIYLLRHVLKHDRYKFGSRTMWILIVVFIQIIGPILYLTIGREDE